jgi:hypothetical protein
LVCSVLFCSALFCSVLLCVAPLHCGPHPIGVTDTFSEDEQAVAWADRLPSFSAQVKNEWRYSSTPPVRLRGVYRDQWHLYLYVWVPFICNVSLCRPLCRLSKRCSSWVLAVGMLQHRSTLE